MSERRKIYVIEDGEYSGYSVICAFEDEDDARRAVENGIGDGYREMTLFAPGVQPKRTITCWHGFAHVHLSGYPYPDIPPHVDQEVHWDYDEVEVVLPQVHTGRPKVKVFRHDTGLTRISVVGADRESTLKACQDAYSCVLAEREGVA